MTIKKPVIKRRLKIIALLLTLAAVLPLSACGRKGPPQFPEGTKYPHQYPSQ